MCCEQSNVPRFVNLQLLVAVPPLYLQATSLCKFDGCLTVSSNSVACYILTSYALLRNIKHLLPYFWRRSLILTWTLLQVSFPQS